MFLPVLQAVADSSALLSVVLVIELFSIQRMNGLIQAVTAFGAGAPPDTRFGYSVEELNEWMDALGEEGRETYMNMVAFDLFPYMEAYALLLGALLLQQLQQTKLDPSYALIFPVVMVCDMLETFIPAWGVKSYPEKLEPIYVEVASTANQLKWILFGAGLLLTSGLFIYNSVRPSAHQPASEKTKEEKKD